MKNKNKIKKMKNSIVLNVVCRTILLMSLMICIILSLFLLIPPELTINLNADDEFVEVIDSITEYSYSIDILHDELNECEFELQAYQEKYISPCECNFSSLDCNFSFWKNNLSSELLKLWEHDTGGMIKNGK